MPRQVGFQVPDEFYAILEGELQRRRDAAPEDEVSFASMMRDLLLTGLGAGQDRPDPIQPLSFPAPLPPAPMTLEQAGEMLLAELPDHQVDIIRDRCSETGQHPVRLLLSYAFLAHERGESSYLMPGDDTLHLQTDKPLPGVSMGTCLYCHKAFVMTRRGQQYCPPQDADAPGCSRLAAEAEWHARRPPSLDLQHQIALKQGVLPQRQPPQPATINTAQIAATVAEVLKSMGLVAAK